MPARRGARGETECRRLCGSRAARGSARTRTSQPRHEPADTLRRNLQARALLYTGAWHAARGRAVRGDRRRCAVQRAHLRALEALEQVLPGVVTLELLAAHFDVFRHATALLQVGGHGASPPPRVGALTAGAPSVWRSEEDGGAGAVSPTDCPPETSAILHDVNRTICKRLATPKSAQCGHSGPHWATASRNEERTACPSPLSL